LENLNLYPDPIYFRIPILAGSGSGECGYETAALSNSLVKGIVQRDLTGVETWLKRSVLMNYIVAKFAF
jgi:hypothetical protein